MQATSLINSMAPCSMNSIPPDLRKNKPNERPNGNDNVKYNVQVSLPCRHIVTGSHCNSYAIQIH